jgi:hypothetical protein
MFWVDSSLLLLQLNRSSVRERSHKAQIILFLIPSAEELRGFESRSCRLQSSLDRVQNDRLVFLKNIGSIINVAEPCESLIKDKVREIMNENQTMLNVSSCELGSFYNNPLISLSLLSSSLSKFTT